MNAISIFLSHCLAEAEEVKTWVGLMACKLPFRWLPIPKLSHAWLLWSNVFVMNFLKYNAC